MVSLMANNEFQFEEVTDRDVPSRRDNPFDAAVEQTRANKFRENGRYLRTSVEASTVNAVKARIRDAAKYLDTGVEFAPEEDGDVKGQILVAFRAKPKAVRRTADEKAADEAAK